MKFLNNLITGTLIAALFSFTACNTTPDTHRADTSDAKQAPELPVEAVEYEADPNRSKMTWIGAKLTENHTGHVSLRDGNLSVKENRIVGGRFIFDMASLRSEDVEMSERDNMKLTGHLMSPDFFDVARHPTAEFEITSVEPLPHSIAEPDSVIDLRNRIVQNNISKPITEFTHTITGNLIIKGVSKSITFPARIQQTDNVISAQANFLIDRTNWNLNYKSERALANKMIMHEVNVLFDILANR